MLNLVGALLILFTATAFGSLQANKYKKRPMQIRQWIFILKTLETEIVYGVTPLPNALKKIAEQVKEPASWIVTEITEQLRANKGMTLQKSWSLTLESSQQHTLMKKVEYDILVQLGYTLGVSDQADQMKHIRLAIQQLQIEEQNASEERQKYEKMWRSLGIMGGILIVILLY